MKKIGIVVCVISVILLTGAMFPLATGSDEVLQEDRDSRELVQRERIVIRGNEDFTLENGVTGGSGTKVDPYIIEGWEIDGEGTEREALILVEDTDVHFVIQDCHIHNARTGLIGQSGMGILTYNVTHMTVRRNRINGTFDGIQMFGSSHSHIYDNDLSQNRAHGITLDSTDHVIIEYNIIEDNSDDGILFGTFGGEQANFNVIRYNYISNNTNYGICLFEGFHNVFHHNIFENIGRRVAVDASQTVNFWNISQGGNWIENHTGPDENGDGFVDEPFPIRNVMGNIVAYDHRPLVEQPDVEFPGESPVIEITFPSGGESLDSGESETITWDTLPGDNSIIEVDLEFSHDGGSSWTYITQGIGDTGSHEWTVPDVSTAQAVIRAVVRDDAGFSGEDISGIFSIIGNLPEGPGDLVVEQRGFSELLDNGIFDTGYEPWDMTRVVDQGEARWDSDGFQEGGSVYVRTEATGEDNITEEYSYWYQGITPTLHELTVSGAFRKELVFGSGFRWETFVHTAEVGIMVHDTELGWQMVLFDDGITLGDSGWQELEPVAYEPQGYVDAIRVTMRVVAEGDTGPQGGEHTAWGELRMDNISVMGVGPDGTENNLLTWDASPDDPGSVVQYSIYRSDDESGPWETPLDVVTARGWARYEYLDPGAGAQDETIWWYVVRAEDGHGRDDGNNNGVPEPVPATESFHIQLHTSSESDGWNFISFNLIPEDGSLETILDGISGSYDRVMYYQASSGRWLSFVPGRPGHYNNLHSWGRAMGIWIRMTSDETLNVTGMTPSSTAVTLYPGWNMVGLPSSTPGNHGLPSEVVSIGYFHGVDEYNIAYTHDVADFVFEPGKGYWLHNGASQWITWTVVYT